MEFGWWVELNYAIPEGDVGRVLEILKIFIFTFAGTSNQNYMRYMLDLYSLLEFECSPDLKEALLNNYLFNLRDELGNFVEGDLTQEWYNRWLEDMVSRRGGDFDDKFYRQTISPNVHHFLKIKEDIESAFDLKRRSKSHTSPHLRDETKVLLQLYKEEELHLFRPGRSMGHAAVNRFDRGLQRLDAGKLDEFKARSKEYSDMVESVEKIRRQRQIDLDPQNAPVRPDTPQSEPRSSPSPSRPETPQSEPRSSPSPSFSEHTSSSSSESQRSPSASSTNSALSFQSNRSSAARAAADSVEAWDDVDHSDEPLTSGSNYSVTVDEMGRMSGDWYDEEEFEEKLSQVDEEVESSEEDEDEPAAPNDIDSDEDEDE
ncbi:hypothetical protein B0H13DRAFT_1700476 [Mycena leptocephala]|nr:hypothetical protein B0H13DRAFT_1700476 [Mycena leptocephala]